LNVFVAAGLRSGWIVQLDVVHQQDDAPNRLIWLAKGCHADSAVDGPATSVHCRQRELALVVGPGECIPNGLAQFSDR
jgi:hypothetical protein